MQRPPRRSASSSPLASSTHTYCLRLSTMITVILKMHLEIGMRHSPTESSTANRNHYHAKKQEEGICDTLEETRPFDVADGHVTFCRHFKYLGSYVSFSLCDDYGIKKQVVVATQSMGALSNIWCSSHLQIWSKYILFCGIPMNLLLWGCETWLIRKALSNKLNVFLHCSIQ